MSLPRSPASPVRVLTGTSALTVCGRSPRRLSARASASEEAASTTSLIVAPWRRPASRELVERRVGERDLAPVRERAAQGGRRRRTGQRVGGGAHLASPGSSARRSTPPTVRAAARRSPACATRAALAARARRPGRRRGLDAVEQQQRDLDRRDPVDQRVVGLADDRPAAAGETVDARHAPQRALHVERPAEQPTRQRAQLAGAAGRGERHAVHVARDVEAGVVDPLLALRRGGGSGAARRAGRRCGAAARRRRGRPVELQRPADMQGRLGGLEVEKRSIQGAEAVGRRHACKKSAAKSIAKGSRLPAEELTRAPHWDALVGVETGPRCSTAAVTHTQTPSVPSRTRRRFLVCRICLDAPCESSADSRGASCCAY